MALRPRALLLLGFWLALVDAGPAAAEVLGAGAWLGVGVAALGALDWVHDPTRKRGLWAYALALAAWSLAEQHFTAAGVTHGKLLPASVALALALSGAEAACGVVAAIYTLAGIAKLRGAGALFLDADYLGTLVLERAFHVAAPLGQLRLALAESRVVITLLAAATLVLELSGALFVFRSARRPLALALVLMHAGIAVAMGYVYVQWAVVVVGLALCPDPAADRSPQVTTPGRPPYG